MVNNTFKNFAYLFTILLVSCTDSVEKISDSVEFTDTINNSSIANSSNSAGSTDNADSADS